MVELYILVLIVITLLLSGISHFTKSACTSFSGLPLAVEERIHPSTLESPQLLI